MAYLLLLLVWTDLDEERERGIVGIGKADGILEDGWGETRFFEFCFPCCEVACGCMCLLCVLLPSGVGFVI